MSLQFIEGIVVGINNIADVLVGKAPGNVVCTLIQNAIFYHALN